jgi:hypothetical protein
MLNRWRLVHLVMATILYSLISLISIYGSQYVLLLMAIALFYCLTMLDKTNTVSLMTYSFLIVISFIYTLFVVFAKGSEYSWYQFFRSGIFTLIFPLMLYVDIRKFFIRHENFITLFCFIVGLGTFADAIFQTNFSPSYIRTAAGDRVYSILFTISPFLLFYSLRKYNLLLLVGSLMVLLASGGKIAYYLIAIVFLLNFTENINLSRVSVKKRSLAIMVMFICFAFVNFNYISEKTLLLLEVGDLSRLKQSEQVIEELNDKGGSWLLGLGHGTRIIDGNYSFSSDVSDRLFVNSQYDVEVGYFHFLARFGIFGICLLFILLIRSPVSTKHFFWFFFVPFIGSSFAGIAPVTSLIGLSLLRLGRGKYD